MAHDKKWKSKGRNKTFIGFCVWLLNVISARIHFELQKITIFGSFVPPHSKKGNKIGIKIKYTCRCEKKDYDSPSLSSALAHPLKHTSSRYTHIYI